MLMFNQVTPGDPFTEMDLNPDIHEKVMTGETLTGSEATAFLAEEFASETHGNYEGFVLWRRAAIEQGFEVTVKRRPV